MDYSEEDSNEPTSITIDLSGVTPYTYSVGTTIGAIGTTIGSNGTFGSAYPYTNPTSSGKLSICGEDADIEIDGKSMKAWMEQVEARLNILVPNPELEKDWDELGRLRERYQRLEQKINKKLNIWDKLKGSDKDNR